MTRLRKILWISILCVSGCALSPQTVTITPDIKVASGSNVQLQKGIAIVVNDVRQNKVLGTRGGIYKDTSSITTDAQIVQSVQNSLTNAFRILGYNVVSGSNAVSLTVDITDLTYTASGDPTIRSVATSAAIKATCRNGSYVLTNDYRITDKKDVLKAPSDSDNVKIINDTLSTTLQRLFNDRGLLDCVNK